MVPRVHGQRRIDRFLAQSPVMTQVGKKGDQVVLVLNRHGCHQPAGHQRTDLPNRLDVGLADLPCLAAGGIAKLEYVLRFTDAIALHCLPIDGQQGDGLVVIRNDACGSQRD